MNFRQEYRKEAEKGLLRKPDAKSARMRALEE